MSEIVLVVPSRRVEQYTKESGVIPVNWEDVEFIVRTYGTFIPRSIAEQDENYRQIIPYVVLRQKDEYIIFKRTENQTEARLHNLITLGVGGHINMDDCDKPVCALRRGLTREINEEVDIIPGNISFVGIINDNSSEVSRVHLGLLFIQDVIEYRGINEKENFVEIRTKNPMEYVDQMEGWARLTAEYLAQ